PAEPALGTEHQSLTADLEGICFADRLQGRKGASRPPRSGHCSFDLRISGSYRRRRSSPGRIPGFEIAAPTIRRQADNRRPHFEGGHMEYGITVPRTGISDQRVPLTYLTSFVREAERAGCTYCVVGDRLESGMDPLSVLTAVAEASGRMRLATSVLVLPPRGILVTAKALASLDVLSGGRVIGGVGTGSLYRDYEVVGMSHAEMWPRFEEGVKAMRAYLTASTEPFRGRFYDTTGVDLEPKPVQRPSLPIWIGSWGS